MRCKTLINLLSRYNQHNIIASLKLQPQRVVFVMQKSKKNREIYKEVRDILLEKLPSCKISEAVLQDEDPKALEQVILQNNSADTVLNITGGTKLMSMIAQQAALQHDINAIYIDMKNQRILDVNNGFEMQDDIVFELNVEELICCSGGEVIKHSSDLYGMKEYVDLLHYVLNHYDMWLSVKRILRNTRQTYNVEFRPLDMRISIRYIDDYDVNYLRQFLNELYTRKLITNLELTNGLFKFTFDRKETKSFIMMAGSWLEALAYNVIKETKSIYDTKSGVLFVWDDEVSRVQNEMDVVAAKDSRLICVSCKDTDSYDIDELNELDVYAEQLGGNDVVKIFVASERPEREEMIFERAKEMGIHIVIFNGDVDKFKSRLQSLL